MVKRWHIWIVNLEPRVGSKPGKQRPCLVIQPDEISEAGLSSAVVLPITTKLTSEDAFPLRVRIPKGICTLSRDSDVMIDQILAWDLSLFRSDLGQIPPSLQRRVKAAIVEFLDLHTPD